MDSEAFWVLLEPHHREAAAFCHKLTGNRETGEDLYQDALLRALRRFHGLRDPSAFRSWLFTILLNTYRNSLRGGWRRSVELTDAIVGCDPRDEQESQRRLYALLSVLRREDRALVVLHDIDGWTISELAQLHHKAEGTIKSRLFRARHKLRRAIERCLPRSTNSGSRVERDYALQTSEVVDP